MRRTLIRYVSTVRSDHRDFPSVHGTDPNDEMDFSDPMMRHMKHNKDIRILSKEEEPVGRAQVKVMEERLSRQLEGKIRAAEIANEVRTQMSDTIDTIKEEMLIGDEIPASVGKITITHIGTLDGYDEKVTDVEMTRKSALQYENELKMSLCLTALNEQADHAYCRLRHLQPFLVRTARSRIALESSQKQLNSDREQHIEEYSIRANIQTKDLIVKCEEICSLLYENKRVRLIARNASNAIDSAELLYHICSVLDEVGKTLVSFSVGAPLFSMHTASSMLIPLSESSPTQLLQYDMLMSLAQAVQHSRDEAFEREVEEEGDAMRPILEEARRRGFYGAQEDFLSTKARDQTIQARLDPWSLPVSNSDLRSIEYDGEMRMAGLSQDLLPTDDQDYTNADHTYVKPSDVEESLYGKPSDHDIELASGIDGKPRVHAAE
eukprot:TRINITY_DN31118_c0_g1_i1.p1 TRINITY_DN31118_c0_g1~~TRINITY_DN31118_c0_g1_i1.p1  ORF type:complete len:436 (+),score=58.73 TRINITY_DN31118_c0_g1_i1:47-1354(+)